MTAAGRLAMLVGTMSFGMGGAVEVRSSSGAHYSARSVEDVYRAELRLSGPPRVRIFRRPKQERAQRRRARWGRVKARRRA